MQQLSDADREAIHDIAHRLAASSKTVAFTGAGVSTESGIPDFRSPGGVWSRHKPVMYDEFIASHQARKQYWAMKREVWRDMSRATPNIVHEFLAEAEANGNLAGVITQNIDGLHQLAGSRVVHELHGTNREAECIECHWRCPIDEAHEQLDAGKEVPECPECEGPLKPATVSFGQMLPEVTFEESQRLSVAADLFLSLGSSLVVYPAAGLPEVARRYGAHLVIINREETPLDPLADAVLRAPLGEVFEELRRVYREEREKQ